jgi:Rrf2 family protein
MFRTKACFYATLALLELIPRGTTAQEQERSHQLARRLGVSATYMAKVLTQLARAGLIRSVRGPRGGFCLARPPDAITLLDVAEAVGETAQVRGPSQENREPAQRKLAHLLATFKQMAEHAQHLLRTTTLADLASKSLGESQSAATGG